MPVISDMNLTAYHNMLEITLIIKPEESKVFLKFLYH